LKRLKNLLKCFNKLNIKPVILFKPARIKESKENQVVNTLEMSRNRYRAVFAVDKLNKGGTFSTFLILSVYMMRKTQ
jgi:hypothetical protein